MLLFVGQNMYNPQYALLILIMELPGLIELPISTTTLYLTMGRVLPIIITKRVRSFRHSNHSFSQTPTHAPTNIPTRFVARGDRRNSLTNNSGPN